MPVESSVSPEAVSTQEKSYKRRERERTSGVELGSKLKSLRLERNWTLESASHATGVAKATLSKIENAAMSPTFDVLQKIAVGFRIDLVDLFDNSAHSPPPGRRTITRKGQGRFLKGSNYGFELLSTELVRKRILPFRARVHARSLSEFGALTRHEGEEFLVVLTGEVLVYTEFYEPSSLKEGDCIYFDSQMGHAVISTSADDAEVLWVCTEASFDQRTSM